MAAVVHGYEYLFKIEETEIWMDLSIYNVFLVPSGDFAILIQIQIGVERSK